MRRPSVPAAERDDYVGGVIEKSSTQRLKISLRTFRKKRAVDLRIWWIGSGIAKPSFRGITVAPEDLDELSRSIRKLVYRARDEGLKTSRGVRK
jgi:hypothetical protein